jgi:serine/threonine protein kinase
MENLRDGTEIYDFDNAEVIKEGGQATVYKIKSKEDGKSYAAKKLKISNWQDNYKKCLL